MAKLRLNFACGPYDRTQALRDGTIQQEGIDLTYLPLQPAEIFWRQLQYREFDVSEMSMSNYTTTLAQAHARKERPPFDPARRRLVLDHRTRVINRSRIVTRRRCSA